MDNSKFNRDGKLERAHEISQRLEKLSNELREVTKELDLDKELCIKILNSTDNTGHIETKLYFLKVNAPKRIVLKDKERTIGCYCIGRENYDPQEPLIDIGDNYLTLQEMMKLHNWLGETIKFYQELKDK